MSKMHCELIEHPDYLEFVVTGQPSEQDWIDLMQRLAKTISARGIGRALGDISGIEAPVEMMVRYRIGVRTGEIFGAGVRIAVLGRDEPPNNFWETVATNRGAVVKSGYDRDELLAWLLEGK